MLEGSTSPEPDWEGLAGRYMALEPGGHLLLLEDFLDEEKAHGLREIMTSSLDWDQRPIVMFGRKLLQPRLTAFHGDVDVAYRYSGQTLKARPWTGALCEIRERLQALLGIRFNSVLCNLYRDGRDSMGWHSDDEAELGQNPVIASVSLGSVRRFLLRSRQGDGRVELSLSNGSLLIMAGDCQHHWQHQVPRTARPMDPRLNLTFRTVFPRHRTALR